MGFIQKFKVDAFKDFGVYNFIETGSWYGDAIHYANSHAMYVDSCEINDKLFMVVSDRFRGNADVSIQQASSVNFLPHVGQLPSIYWLDAHLPELYTNANTKYSPDVTLPLAFELKIILKKETVNQSIVLIDDVRMYHPEFEYSGGNIRRLNNLNLIEFCKREFKNHDVFLSENDQGYLILTPKNIKAPFTHELKVRSI